MRRGLPARGLRVAAPGPGLERRVPEEVHDRVHAREGGVGGRDFGDGVGGGGLGEGGGGEGAGVFARRSLSCPSFFRSSVSPLGPSLFQLFVFVSLPLRVWGCVRVC